MYNLFLYEGDLRILKIKYAQVVKLVDTSVLGTDAARREGSSPFLGTKNNEVKARALADLFFAQERT